ncbi:3-oxoacyl-[acyl-carrier-protein] synthase III C-terminal domain-containing protein [Escherichia coli]|nr:3-oxoacyl-[acyl-carrier-protein] synthase III C-terminal domain-containing protein [Escherichia coli]
MTQFAFVFPGQGSQTVGMLADMAASYPIVEETFAEASAALGYDLWALTQQGPAEELNKTWQTQPALLTASVALYRVWQQQGGKAPAMMAGHSLGEYSALVCAGVIDFADAVRLVEMRGKFMQEAVPEGTGAMAAIISATAKKLGMSMDNVVVTLDRHGNTSAASVPCALDEAVRDGRIKPGQLVLLEAFGGGFTWGSALVRF